MSEERWDQIRELFHHALDLPTADRASFLNTACSDAAMRVEVESLLGHADGSLLDSPAVLGVREAIAAAAKEEAVARSGVSGVGRIVDSRYHLLEKVGEGGMGEVWRVEQREPIRRQLAFKLVKAGMNSRQVIARFESERRTLALMDHPAIAKVVDAGSMADGRPTSSWSTWTGRRSPAFATVTGLRSASGWTFSCTSAKACSTRIKRPSSIAT